MTRTRTIAVAASIVVATATVSVSSHAEGTGYPSAAALLGVGFRDPAGVGLGVRGGYTLPVKIYVGGTFVYHFGSSEDTAAGKATQNILYFGVEGGYEIDVGPVLLRPYVGIGDMIGNASTPNVCAPSIGCIGGDVSSSSFAVWPGVTALYPLDQFFVGGDARFAIATSNSDATVFGIFATGGMRF